MEEFKGNPVPVETPRNREKCKPIATDVTVKKEGNLAKKFFAQDLKTTGTNVFNETIIPSAKKIISDIVKKSIDFLLYGTFTNNGNYTDYRGVTTQKLTSISPIPSYTSQQNYSRLTSSGANMVYNIVIHNEAQARDVLYELQNDCRHFGMVSVAEYYEKVNVAPNFTDNDWGWRNLDNAYIQRLGENDFKIVLPKIESLK